MIQSSPINVVGQWIGWDGNGDVALIKCEVLKNSKLKLSMTRTNSKDNGRGEEGLDTYMLLNLISPKKTLHEKVVLKFPST